MVNKKKVTIVAAIFLAVVTLLIWYLYNHSLAVLNPAGEISHKERQLMIVAIVLSALVVLPVYFLTILIAVKYHEKNEAKYSPEFDSSKLYESIWWAIPIVIIGILSVITWRSSHSLDPYRQLASSKAPVTVQVVALDWKWLFIYPEKHIASVNEMDIPKDRPVNLYITSDSVMNSFWVPNLAGQIYAMPGMSTQLHIMSNKVGSYYGSSANISGKGFSGMHFMVNALNDSSFNNWQNKLSKSSNRLSLQRYSQLAAPSENNQVSYYGGISNNLFDYIIMKYMDPFTPGTNI